MMYKAGIYLRLSKEDGENAESNSIESQRKIIRNYLMERKMFCVVSEYVDDGYTGTNFERPGIRQLLADVKKGTINCVVVKDMSRFGRNYLEAGKYIQILFREYKVRFIAVNDGVDVDAEQDSFDLMLPFRNVINESYSRDISKKVQSSFKAMQREGIFCGAYASYGYQKSKKDRHRLVIDPYAAEIVRGIYECFLQGEGQIRIAQKLNERGILCPSEYKRSCGENYRNSKKLEHTTYWTYSTVHKILKNQMYCGDMVQNKTKRGMREKAVQRPREEWLIVKNTHEPIISREKYELVQRLLENNHEHIDFNRNRNYFAGVLKCADCGRAMAKKNYKNTKGERYSEYYCGSYIRYGSGICSSHKIKQEELNRIVLDDLNAVIKKVDQIDLLVEKQNENIRKKTDHKREINKIKFEIEKKQRERKGLYRDYKEGILTKEEYLEMKGECKKTEDFLIDKVHFLEGENVSARKEKTSPWVEDLLRNKEVRELDSLIINEMVEGILIYEKDREGSQKVQIQYKCTKKEFPQITISTCGVEG